MADSVFSITNKADERLRQIWAGKIVYLEREKRVLD